VLQQPYPDDDRNMVGKCQKGDSLAFEELVRKYQQTVFNLAYRYLGSRNEVEDVAQKIFTKVYFSLPKFDLRRPFFPCCIVSQSTSATTNSGVSGARKLALSVN